MVQAAFCHEGESAIADRVGLALSVSIFSDNDSLRSELRHDAQGIGLRIARCETLEWLCSNGHAPLADIVLLDCALLNGRSLAMLCALDSHAARSASQLVVFTSMAALEDVFGCLDSSRPDILVNPAPAERLIALGRALAQIPRGRVRELSEDDRLILMRMMEQVGQLASKLDRIGVGRGDAAFAQDDSAFRFASPDPGFRAEEGEDPSDRLVRAARPPLPDPRLVRRIIRQRQLRGRFLDPELFADPAWDMLLDLTAARVEHTRVSVTSLCIASGVPPTTALRWIGQLTEAGLVERIEDDTDRRRAFIVLTDKAADAMARYFAELGRNAGRLV